MDDFSDIRPYTNNELRPVLKKITNNRWLVSGVRSTFVKDAPRFIKAILNFFVRYYIKLHFIGINTTDQFSKRISLNVLVKYLIKNTTSGISFTGLDYLDPLKSYVFISNHRDIVLDPALMVKILTENGFKIPQIAFGDNLMMNSIIGELIRINNGFIVKRNLPMRDQVKESIRLSQYINKILSENISVWIAQREGRAKDGIDTTNPAVIKMLYLAKRKEMSINDFVKQVRIVPVSISYEFDPCDRLKGWALYRKRVYGNHIKRKFEDLVHITGGMKGFKGMVNFAFSRPLSGTYETIADVVKEIDRSIQTGYKLWKSNYIAYDTFTGTDKYSSRYDRREAARFLRRYKKIPEDVRNIILQSYANPVISFENQIR